MTNGLTDRRFGSWRKVLKAKLQLSVTDARL